MGSIVSHTKKRATIPTGKVSKSEYTPKGNKLYHFTSVSKEELERLRVPSYRYLL
jgi:hypothetical protein